MTDTMRYETVHPKDRALFASIDKALAEYERTRKVFASSPAQHLPRSVPCSAIGEAGAPSASAGCQASTSRSPTR
jgi:hypothetical protein